MHALVAADEPHAARLADELRGLGWEAEAVAASAPAAAAEAGLRMSGGGPPDTLIVIARHDTLTREVVSACDRDGVRIVPVGEGDVAERRAQAFGLASPLPTRVSGRELVRALREPLPAARGPQRRRRVIAVWGPAGAPGRSTIAIELAVELGRAGSSVLVDADTHAPSIAIALGLPDEGPGFAAACRQVQRGQLDAAELDRIAIPLSRTTHVLTGINRPSRWPELREDRVRGSLAVCREWVDDTVVDVASGLDRDEEIVSDLTGERRNAATIASLLEADLIVAVAGADPVGIGRFVRGYAQLRETVGSTPIAVVANRLRPGALGVDARGQVRRTLDRFAAIRDVWFVPQDPRSADAALLAARPIAEVARRSPIVASIRRFVSEALSAPARTGAEAVSSGL